MKYEFKPLAEIVRAVALAAIVFVAISATQLGSVTDWGTWVSTFGTGFAAAIGAAVLGALTPNP